MTKNAPMVNVPLRHLSVAALLLAACSSGATAPGSPGNEADAAPDAQVALDAAGSDAADGGAPDAPGPVPHDAAPDVDARTIPPVTPGVWRDITPAELQATVGSSTPCTDIQIDPKDRSILYAMFGGAGIYKSTDAGATWKQIGNLPKPVSLGRLLIDPNDSNHMFATGSVQGSSLGLWVSTDGGNTFTVPPAFAAGVGQTWNQDVYNIVSDPTDFRHILMTFHNAWPGAGNAAGILESRDGGQSFTAHPPAAGMDVGQGIAFLYDPARGIGDASTWLVGAGYGAGLFRTSNGGASWESVSTVQENHGGFDAHYSSQGFLYIGMSDGVYRSTDNGKTWTNVAQGAMKNWTYSVIGDGKFLYTSPAFVGQEFNQPFFKAQEGGPNEGTAWAPMSAQTVADGPWKMVLDQANGIIYSASWSGGAWALTVD